MNDYMHRDDVIPYVAGVMRYTISTVKAKIMRRKDFPKPVKQIGRDYAIWQKKDLDKFLGIYAESTQND